ncbi:MAG: hypothetical protein M3680_15600 [Myxococcota bacterium]|nr:hypothetical protein [Myxococcota bacterium]
MTECELYVRDLFYLLREAAAEARRNQAADPRDGLESGRAAAYVEVLLLMQSQADSFMIPRERLGMAGFDPLLDPLDPPLDRIK